MKINHLTPSEELLMNILWKLDSAYMKEVIENYPAPKPHQNTISTFIKILVEKDFLTTEKEGRIFKYTVAVPFEDYRKFQLKNFLKNYFDDSASELLKTLMEENWLQTSDIEKIFEIESIPNPLVSTEKKDNEISDYIVEITAEKKSGKKEKKKKKKKKDEKKMIKKFK